MFGTLVLVLHCSCAEVQERSIREGYDFLKDWRHAEAGKLASFPFSTLSLLLLLGASLWKQAVPASHPVGDQVLRIADLIVLFHRGFGPAQRRQPIAGPGVDNKSNWSRPRHWIVLQVEVEVLLLGWGLWISYWRLQEGRGNGARRRGTASSFVILLLSQRRVHQVLQLSAQDKACLGKAERVRAGPAAEAWNVRQTGPDWPAAYNFEGGKRNNGKAIAAIVDLHRITLSILRVQRLLLSPHPGNRICFHEWATKGTEPPLRLSLGDPVLSRRERVEEGHLWGHLVGDLRNAGWGQVQHSHRQPDEACKPPSIQNY